MEVIKMKERLIVDMDGVLSDIYGQLLCFEWNEFQVQQDRNLLAGKTEREAFVNFDKYIHSEGFFLNSPIIEDSVEIMEALNQKYDLFIVSAALQFPLSLYEKVQWLKKYFPFITWKQIVLCGTKELIQGDIMIDDHFMNLDRFSGKTLLFTQPHNIDKHTDSHIRVNNWLDVKRELL